MTSSAATPPPPAFIEVGKENAPRRIAVRARAGGSPGLFWLGGFKSDMQGTKAIALDDWALSENRACVRFDYSGHGESGGDFIDGTIGRWLEESIAVFDQFCTGPQVVIGSSMGGWMALLLARELARRQATRASLAGLVLIAPAPDFTEELMWKGFSPQARQEIETRAYGCALPNMVTLPDHPSFDRRKAASIFCSAVPSSGMSGADPAGCAGSRRCHGATPSRWRIGCRPTTWC